MILPLPGALRELISRCERHCLAACCGLHAFDIDAVHMIAWANQEGVRRLWECLDQFSEVIADVRGAGGPVSSEGDEMNHIWDTPADCIAHLRIWQAELVRAVEAVTRRPTIEPGWRTSAVVGLAGSIRAAEAFDRLPILADALEDAGCDHPDVLGHCRGSEPHARGCWVVDLVLDPP